MEHPSEALAEPTDHRGAGGAPIGGIGGGASPGGAGGIPGGGGGASPGGAGGIPGGGGGAFIPGGGGGTSSSLIYIISAAQHGRYAVTVLLIV
ncbi:MAG: hypothetical protein ACJZ59_03020 [Candidatus Thalassarchaeaceae archaeon]